MAKSKSGKDALDELIRSVSAKEDLLIPLSEKDRKDRDKKKEVKPIPEKELDPVEVFHAAKVEEPAPSKIEHLADLMRHLSLELEKSKIAEFVEIQKNPFRQALKGIVKGFFQGLGIALAIALVWWSVQQFSVPEFSLPKVELPKLNLKVPGFIKKLPSFHQ